MRGTHAVWLLTSIVSCAAPGPPPPAAAPRIAPPTEPEAAPTREVEPAEKQWREPPSGDAALGREHYQQHCASCHGEDGRGETARGIELGIADMTTSGWQERREDRDIRVFVRRGVPARGQPAFGPEVLDDEALDQVVAYIRWLGQ